MRKHRLYIDEVGNPDLGASRDPNHRFLSLTGVVFELEYVRTDLAPSVESLKSSFFESHPDDPIVLHRSELVNRRPPFHALRNQAVEQRFNETLLDLLHTLEYTVITVVMDKLEHSQRYRVWQADPYHYCLEVMVERFVLWLRAEGAVGDVMSESRNGKENQRLMDSFTRVHERGSSYLASDVFAAHLTSRQLKVKPKSANISGLQIADLLAHPSFKATQARRQRQELPDNFGGRVAAILEESKYLRSAAGKIEGWGRKWLP